MTKYTRLNFEERIKIETFIELNWTLTAIGIKLNRPKSTISRELSRFPFTYKADKAQVEADRKGRKHNCNRRLELNVGLKKIVHKYLKKHWSPEQISRHLRKQFAGRKEMQLSHESIYSYIYVLPN